MSHNAGVTDFAGFNYYPLLQSRLQGEECRVESPGPTKSQARHRTVFKHTESVMFRVIVPTCGLALQERKRSKEKSKADQGGVAPPQKAVKAMKALQRATPHPMGNWSCAAARWLCMTRLCMVPRSAHCAVRFSILKVQWRARARQVASRPLPFLLHS